MASEETLDDFQVLCCHLAFFHPCAVARTLPHVWRRVSVQDPKEGIDLVEMCLVSNIYDQLQLHRLASASAPKDAGGRRLPEVAWLLNVSRCGCTSW